MIQERRPSPPCLFAGNAVSSPPPFDFWRGNDLSDELVGFCRYAEPIGVASPWTSPRRRAAQRGDTEDTRDLAPRSMDPGAGVLARAEATAERQEAG